MRSVIQLDSLIHAVKKEILHYQAILLPGLRPEKSTLTFNMLTVIVYPRSQSQAT